MSFQSCAKAGGAWIGERLGNLSASPMQEESQNMTAHISMIYRRKARNFSKSQILYIGEELEHDDSPFASLGASIRTSMVYRRRSGNYSESQTYFLFISSYSYFSLVFLHIFFIILDISFIFLHIHHLFLHIFIIIISLAFPVNIFILLTTP